MKHLLFFCGPGCRPCTLLFPIVQKIAEETGLELKKIDIVDNLELAAEYGIESVPQLLVIENNNVNGRLVGLASDGEVRQLLEESEVESK